MPRPPTPLISRRLAVETALRIIDEEGYARFSLEKLARTLNVKSPSLYHHFAGRDDLLTATAFHLLADIPRGPKPDPERWQEWFVHLCVQTHRRVMAHPRAAGLLFTYFPDALTTESHEQSMAIFAEQGFPVEERWAVMRGLEKLLFGLALADADDLVAGRDHQPVEPERYPLLVAALASERRSAEQVVETAVRSYLTGAAALHATAGRPRKAV